MVKKPLPSEMSMRNFCSTKYMLSSIEAHTKTLRNIVGSIFKIITQDEVS